MSVQDGKIALSLRESECFSRNGLYLRSLFKSQQSILKLKGKKQLKKWDAVGVDQVVTCVVDKVMPFGCFVSLEGEALAGITGFATDAHFDHTEVQVG